MVPYLHITTRIPGRAYDGLLGEKGGTGFPTLMYLDAEGRVLARHAGQRSVKGFEESLEGVQEFAALLREAESGDPGAQVEVLIRQLQMEWFDFEDARARVAALPKVDSKEKKVLDQLLVDTEVRSVVRNAGEDTERRLAGGAHFLAMWEEKRVPEGESELYAFWSLIADHAEAERDKKLFKRVVDAFDDTLKNTRYGQVLERFEERLENFPKK